jgi:peptidoglycan hydrolase-like protein with peptidoglycan-binding domain
VITLKKYLIVSGIALFFVIPNVSFSQTVDTTTSCLKIQSNMTYGLRDNSNVKSLQLFLVEQGYMNENLIKDTSGNFKSTFGTFGINTSTAVKEFQLDTIASVKKDYLDSGLTPLLSEEQKTGLVNGDFELSPATKLKNILVGRLTREKIAYITCHDVAVAAVDQSQVCDYAVPPTGCRYVAGVNYNKSTQCGMVLNCSTTIGTAATTGKTGVTVTNQGSGALIASATSCIVPTFVPGTSASFGDAANGTCNITLSWPNITTPLSLKNLKSRIAGYSAWSEINNLAEESLSSKSKVYAVGQDNVTVAITDVTGATLSTQTLSSSCAAGAVRDTSGSGKCLPSSSVSSSPTSSTYYNISVVKQGNGSGVIVSRSGIDCGPLCSKTLSSNDSTVTFSATPLSGSVFAGWSGEASSCGTSTSCTIPMVAAKNVVATFTVAPVTTSVGALCADGTYASLVVIGASTGCENHGGVAGTTSNTTLNTSTSVVSSPSSYKLSVSKQGSGSGVIISASQGVIMDCGPICTGVVPPTMSAVTLSAEPGTNSTFTTWAGDASICGSSKSCTLPITASKNIIAIFSSTLSSSSATPVLTWSKSTYVIGESISAVISGGNVKDTWACMDSPNGQTCRTSTSGWRKLGESGDAWVIQGGQIVLSNLSSSNYPAGTYTGYQRNGQYGAISEGSSFRLVAATPSSFLNSNVPVVLGDFASNISCINLSRDLHRGTESSSVTDLQKFLSQKGFLTDITGFYGDKTVEAVKDYQASKNLPVTGMVYDFTRQAISNDSCH